jgi:hypothetical protein
MTTNDDTAAAHAMPRLFIPLKREYFDAFRLGKKTEEFRPYGPRWNEKTCVIGRAVTLSLGYTQHRIHGVVTSFRTDDHPFALPGWTACYGAKHSTAARIGISITQVVVN